MNIKENLILLLLLMCPYASIRAVSFTSLAMTHDARTSLYDAPSKTGSSSFGTVQSAPSVYRSSFNVASGMQLPARTITHSNLDLAFEDTYGNSGAAMSPRRGSRDDDYGNPSDPTGLETPVGDVPWCFFMAGLLAVCYLRRQKSLSPSTPPQA